MISSATSVTKSVLVVALAIGSFATQGGRGRPPLDGSCTPPTADQAALAIPDSACAAAFSAGAWPLSRPLWLFGPTTATGKSARQSSRARPPFGCEFALPVKQSPWL